MESVTLCSVGDVAAFFKEPESMFAHTASILKEADITFAQNERHYTDRYTEEHLLPGIAVTEVCPRGHAAALKLGGFDVMSFASNHCMDLGPEAMMETVSALKENGFAVIGAGRNIEEARKPVIFERKGTKIAYLAYCSVLRPGWEAGENKPGSAPLRASTFYKQVDFQAGTEPAIITMADAADLAAMKEDIKKVRPLADVVVVSMHWGVHNTPGVIAMYQREVAHAAIDAGVDLIIGHHPHVLKGIEVYRGKAIFYSMGNFAFDMPLAVRMDRAKRLKALNWNPFHGIKPDPEYADWYSWAPDCRKSMIAKCVITNKKIERLSFFPVLINNRAQPVVITDEKEFQGALAEMHQFSNEYGFHTQFKTQDGEIVVLTS